MMIELIVTALSITFIVTFFIIWLLILIAGIGGE